MKRQNYLFAKVFIPFLSSFFIIGFIALFSLDKIHKQYQDIRTKEIIQNIESIYENKIKENNNIYKELILGISRDKNIKEAFLQKDRKKLYNLTKKIYKRFNKEFQITHFYFFEANRKTFLRVHNKNTYGDIINRFTLKSAQENKKISTGIEFGISHNLTSRFVSPYYHKGKIIGYLELGEEIDYFTPYLSKILNAEILITIRKDLIDNKNINLSNHLKTKIASYPKSEDYYIINSTLKYINNNIIELINRKINDTELNKNITRNYEIGRIKLFDIQKKEVGEIIVLINSENSKVDLIKLKTQLSILIFIIAIIIISIYYFYLKKTTDKLKKSTKNIIKLTNTDQLTNLYNRRYFKRKVPRELLKATRYDKSISFLMIDIDCFKLYNDNYGHLKGDEVIKDISKVLKKSLKRSSDMAFRMGGEEFGILIIEDENNISAPIIAKKILEDIYQLNIIHEYNMAFKKVTVSIGITTRKAEKNLISSTLYEEADKALYKAKENGRNRIEFF